MVNPAEIWDHNASMDMRPADPATNERLRGVQIQTPKNGFRYMLDRMTEKPISADRSIAVTWTKSANLVNGQPFGGPRERYPEGSSVVMQPGSRGAHEWLRSTFSPKSELVYPRESGRPQGDAAAAPPDLRTILRPSAETFEFIAKSGGLAANGRPRFDGLNAQRIAHVRRCIRNQAAQARTPGS